MICPFCDPIILKDYLPDSPDYNSKICNSCGFDLIIDIKSKLNTVVQYIVYFNNKIFMSRASIFYYKRANFSMINSDVNQSIDIFLPLTLPLSKQQILGNINRVNKLLSFK